MPPLRLGLGGFVATALVALLATGVVQQWWTVPDRWNPWAPLLPLDPPNTLTPYKLARLDADPAACSAAVATTRVTAAPVPDRPLAGGCGWTGALRVGALPARVGPSFVLTCPAVVALAMWEAHALQPAAVATFGRRVAAVEHFGSFACRDIGGGAPRGDAAGTGRRSEHARANALDVAAFVLDDGSTVSVVRDWDRGDADRRGRFLRAVHDGACPFWHVVLGPAYDAAHRDHFHLDRGPARACR